MHKLAMPGPDGNAGAMGGNSGGDGIGDPALIEIAYGPGTWRSPVQAGMKTVDRRNG